MAEYLVAARHPKNPRQGDTVKVEADNPEHAAERYTELAGPTAFPVVEVLLLEGDDT